MILVRSNKKVGAGFGVMILREDKVLLGKRHHDPNKASSLLNGAGTWTMPGGKLDFQESFGDGAYREVKEETGLEIAKDKLKLISVSNDMVEEAHFVTLGFLCQSFVGEPKALEPDEITEWLWFDLDDLPKPLYFPSEKVLSNYKDKKIY